MCCPTAGESYLINFSVCVLFNVISIKGIIHHFSHCLLNQTCFHHLFGHLLHGLVQLWNLDEIIYNLHDLHITISLSDLADEVLAFTAFEL